MWFVADGYYERNIYLNNVYIKCRCNNVFVDEVWSSSGLYVLVLSRPAPLLCSALLIGGGGGLAS